MNSSLRLETVTRDNVSAACRLTVRPEQEHVVAPVAWSLAEAYVNPEIAWPRLVFDGDELAGFVMGGFDPHGPEKFYLRLGFRPAGEVIHEQVVGEILLA